MYLSFVSYRMDILGKYFVQDSFGKPEIKTFCYQRTCDLSCASVTVHVRNTQGRFYMILAIVLLVDLNFTLCN